MDIALTDLLTCPRCGPSYGLVVLPGEVRDRRIRSGVLGCANCRERYRLDEWVADLRPGGQGEVEEGESPFESDDAGRPEREEAVRLAALLGLSEPGGVVVLTGTAAVQAGLLGQVVSGIREVVVVSDPERLMADGDVASASYVRVSGALPFRVLPLRDRSVRGVVLAGRWSELVEEGARLVAPAGRLVLDPAPSDAVGRVEGAGLRVQLDEAGVVVAGRGR